MPISQLREKMKTKQRVATIDCLKPIRTNMRMKKRMLLQSLESMVVSFETGKSPMLEKENCSALAKIVLRSRSM